MPSLTPESAEEAAEALHAAAQAGESVGFVGGGTKQDRGHPTPAPDRELRTTGLGALLEHNAGDLTAVVQAGLPLAAAQEAFGAEGQMLALDPPNREGRATVGGVFSCADAGPLRHRYGPPRDLVLGVQLALPDGSVARAGGRVIKNVAGYDLAKLSTGALGTLGLVVELVVRLHPRPEGTLTAVGESSDPAALARARGALGRAPFELECLDVAWAQARGALLARAAGPAARAQIARVEELMAAEGLDVRREEDDEGVWESQRAREPPRPGGVSVKVSAPPAALATVLGAAEAAGGHVVGRAGHGVHWVGLPPAGDAELVAGVAELRARLGPSPCVVEDAPRGVRAALDPWDVPAGPELALMRRVKQRFDPARTCNPGRYVGGI